MMIGAQCELVISIDTESLSSTLYDVDRHFIQEPADVKICSICHNLDSSQNCQKQKKVLGEYIFTFFCQFIAQNLKYKWL